MSSSLQDLGNQIRDCTRCPLYKTRIQAVPGVGDEQSPLMIIGEAPGETEDQYGLPFVGKTGQLLRDLLRAANIEPQSTWMSNTVRCRPWIKDQERCSNRPPTPQEMGMCYHWLQQEISILTPKVIVCAGAKAASVILGRQATVSKDSKKWHQEHRFAPAQARVIHHPSYIIRLYGQERKMAEETYIAELLEAAAMVQRLTNNPVPEVPKEKPIEPKLPADPASQLLSIYEQALEKIQSGDYDLFIIDKDYCATNGTDQNTPEDEVLNWMLAKSMGQRGDKRYERTVKYIKAPKNVTFKTTDFDIKDIIFFVSPQTAQTQ